VLLGMLLLVPLPAQRPGSAPPPDSSVFSSHDPTAFGAPVEG
jgi:hypothetical protein